MFQLWPNKPSTQNLSSAFFCHYSNSFFFTPKQSALNRTPPFSGNYEPKLPGLGAASHLQRCWWLCFNQQTLRILLHTAWVWGWQGGWLPGHKEKEEALRGWRNLHFPQGTCCKQGPLFLAAGTHFSPQTDPFLASPFFLLSEKGHFQSLYFYIHPRPKSV